MYKKHLLVPILALALTTIASLSTSVAPVAAQNQQTVKESCLGTGEIFRTSLKDNVVRNFTFGGRKILLFVDEKEAEIFGVYMKTEWNEAEKANDYWFMRVSANCYNTRDELQAAVQRQYPKKRVYYSEPRQQ